MPGKYRTPDTLKSKINFFVKIPLVFLLFFCYTFPIPHKAGIVFSQVTNGRDILTHVHAPMARTDELVASVHAVLDQTTICIDETGRIRLVYQDQRVEQSYDNGNRAGTLCTNGQAIFAVDRCIEEKILGHNGTHFIGFDGRERRNASVLFRTTAPPPVRVAIRRIDQPEETAELSNKQIMVDIAKRDRAEQSLLRGIFQDEVNVLEIYRRRANSDSDARIAEEMSWILVDFSRGRTESNFGTINIVLR